MEKQKPGNIMIKIIFEVKQLSPVPWRLVLIIILFMILFTPAQPSTINPGNTGSVLQGYPSPLIDDFKTFVIYLGDLNASNLLWISMDYLVVRGSPGIIAGEAGLIDELNSRGVEVYVYPFNNSKPLLLGEAYRFVVNGSWSRELYVGKIEFLINQYANHVDGVFLSGVDPRLYGYNGSNNQLLEGFSTAVEAIVNYTRSMGLRVFINGTPGYAGLGDYYLWDGYVTRPVGRGYDVDPGFYDTDNSDPYGDISGINTYEYLEKHGLLNKTIALSYDYPARPSNCLLGYYMARIMGLAGWGYTGRDYYVNGGYVYDLPAPLLGPSISAAEINATSTTASRFFITGPITVDLSLGIYNASAKAVNTTPWIDGVTDKVYVDSNASIYIPPVFCLMNRINKIYYALTPWNLYLLVDYDQEEPLNNMQLKIFIDTDNNVSTGYPVGGIGAEYLINTTNYGETILYRIVYNGTKWIPVRVDQPEILLYKYRFAGPHRAILEYGLNIPVNTSRGFGVYAVSPACADPYTNTTLNTTARAVISEAVILRPDPTLYNKDVVKPRYGYAVIKHIEVEAGRTVVIADAQTGVVARYELYLPYRGISRVYKNSTILPNKTTTNGTEWYTYRIIGNYTQTTLQVIHSSSVNISIIPIINNNTIPQTPNNTNTTTQPTNEPEIIPAIILTTILLLLIHGQTWKRIHNSQ